jgi:uncharacterized protein (DUF362 family)
MNRREFIKKSVILAGTLTGSLSFPDKGVTAPKREDEITVVEGDNLSAQVREAIRLSGGIEKFVKRGDRVILLPNPQGRGPGASTNADMVYEVVRLCKEAGAASVTASSVHGPWRWSSTQIVEKVEQAGGKMKYSDSSKDWVTVNVPGGRVRKKVTIIKDAIENDVLINIPVFKDHYATRVTGTLKNLMGLNSDSGSFHQGEAYLHQAIIDLASVIPPHLCIVDATTILVENGPFGPGKVAHPKKVYAGTDLVAIDSLCCGLLKINPTDVLHIKLAHESGLGQIHPSEKNIKGVTLKP